MHDTVSRKQKSRASLESFGIRRRPDSRVVNQSVNGSRYWSSEGLNVLGSPNHPPARLSGFPLHRESAALFNENGKEKVPWVR